MTTVASAAPRHPFAVFVSRALSPFFMVAIVLLLAAWKYSETTSAGVAWGALTVGLVLVAPGDHLVRQIRRGTVGDIHVRDRAQRPAILAIATVFILVTLVIAFFAARREMFAVVGALTAGLVSFTLVTLLWKISFHAGVLSGVLAILEQMFGPWVLVASPLLLLSGWARVTLRDHTLAQVIVGTVLGAAVAGGAFALLAR